MDRSIATPTPMMPTMMPARPFLHPECAPAPMPYTMVLPSFPGYSWEWFPPMNGWRLRWEPVRSMYSPPRLHPGITSVFVGVDPVLAYKIGTVIGKNGAHLKTISEASGAPYIWFRSDIGQMEIWGLPQHVAVAKEMLSAHLMATHGRLQPVHQMPVYA